MGAETPTTWIPRTRSMIHTANWTLLTPALILGSGAFAGAHRLGQPWSSLPPPSPLFRSLVGTTQQSDSLPRTSVAHVLGLSTAARNAIRHGRSQGLPVLAHDASTHARGLDIDRARPQCTSPYWCIRCCLRPQTRTRHLEGELDFAAQYPACVCPCQRFGRALTRAPT